MLVIVEKGSRRYGAAMASAIFRLLALISLVLMPLGMAGAPAVAQSGPAAHTMAQMGHCGEQPDQDKAPVSKMDCTAMCTALPAADTPALAAIWKPAAPHFIVVAAPFSGIEPEIAIPPPKRA